jgi:rubrerythrin
MYTPEQILKAAQTIQSRLDTLLDAQTAMVIAAQLQTLINQAQQGQPVENDILMLFASDDRLRQDAREILEDPSVNKGLKGGFQAMAGTGKPRSYPLYKCPDCGESWSQIDPDETVPTCPKDPSHQPLQRI